jgi:cystatin-C
MGSRRHAVAVILTLLLAVAMASSSEKIPGGWWPIKNVNDPEVQEIARFAVAEHNRHGGGALVYVSTISGETQVVSGLNYRLLIAARPIGACSAVTDKYQAVVYDQSWTGTRQLTSFKRVA